MTYLYGLQFTRNFFLCGTYLKYGQRFRLIVFFYMHYCNGLVPSLAEEWCLRMRQLRDYQATRHFYTNYEGLMTMS